VDSIGGRDRKQDRIIGGRGLETGDRKQYRRQGTGDSIGGRGQETV